MTFFSTYQELDNLGIGHNTNKSSSWVRPDGQRTTTNDSLLSKYEFFLQFFRRRSGLNVLELGAGPDENIGASVRVWRDYFPGDAQIHVADIKSSAQALESEGFRVHIGDLGSPSFLRTLKNVVWDIVIDDASHIWYHQIMSFRALFPNLKSGGVFIMEDLCTSFAHHRPYYCMGLDAKDAVSYFLALSRACCAPWQATTDADLRDVYCLTKEDFDILPSIHMMSWISNACIIVKR